MSPLWPDRLRVAFAPSGVTLVRESGLLRRRVAASTQLPCDPDLNGNAWHGAIGALTKVLGEPPWQGGRLEVTLSDRLVRYQLLPWMPELRTVEERQGYARFHFRQVFGAMADGWEIRVDDAPPGMSGIACAIDHELLRALRTLAESARSRIGSIQPAFAVAFNRMRRELRGGPTMLALLDGDRLCLALVSHGRWLALRQRTLDGEPAEAMRAALEQERLLADPPFEMATLYLIGGTAAVTDHLDESWTVRPVTAGAFA